MKVFQLYWHFVQVHAVEHVAAEIEVGLAGPSFQLRQVGATSRPRARTAAPFQFCTG